MPKIKTNTFNSDEVTFQQYFYNKVLGSNNSVRIDRNTDGYLDGIIFEHKQNVTSYGRSKALSQALIYLTRFNRDGIPVPKNILLVSQDENKAYLYDANDYKNIINAVEKYANIQGSQGIEGFKEKWEPETIDYDLDNLSKCRELLNIINQKAEYVKVNISAHNVYGWSDYYYHHSKIPKKVKFFNELRNPKDVLKNYIEPWRGEEKDFSLIMDLLNDPSQKKKLGAFYTPPEYAKKAIELVRMAIKDVPRGNDYIILDRCAGTGSLEYELSDEELSHVVVNTFELKEWHALKDRLGGLVRCVLPPIPKKKNTYPNYDDKTGFLNGADALSKEFLERKEISKYINNPKCNIILFENPPYADDAADTPQTGKSRGSTANTFMANEMNKVVKSDFSGLIQSKDILNLFVWSGFNYYLKKKNDAYILFSPVKCWKVGHLINKTFIKGFLFNREYFHANKSAISCIYWKNVDDVQEQLQLDVIDIDDGKCYQKMNVIIKKTHKAVNEYLFDKRKFENDTNDGIWCARNGNESDKLPSTSTENIFNDNIIGYIHLVGMGFDPKNIGFVRTALNLRKNGFYLRKDNFIKKLPLFCAKAYPQYNWYETDIYSTTADGGNVFERDKQFLKKCLIWSCLTNKNHCKAICGSDKRFYQNQLCFEKGTLASKELERLKVKLTDEENELISEYNNILREIKKKDKRNKKKYTEYNEQCNYSIYQIDDEINIDIETGKNDDGTPIFSKKYGDLNNTLIEYKKKVQKYYDNNLIKDLFKYELIK